MFWIGMIAGIVFTLVVSFAFFMWCMKTANCTFDDFEGMVALNSAIIENRECDVEVYHNGDCVHSDTFVER